MRSSRALRRLLFSWIALAAIATGAGADDRPMDGSYVCFGPHLLYVFEPDKAAQGVSAALLLRSHALMPLSETLANSGLGFVFRWNRAHLARLARLEGGELLLRYYIKSARDRWHPFVGGGLGQYGIDWDASERRRSSWSTILEGGVERELGARFQLELALHNRLIEFTGDSFSGSSLIFTFGVRFDT